MSIKFKNRFISILLCFLFLIVVVLFACFDEENIFINEKDKGFSEPESPPGVNEPPITFSDEEVTIVTTGIEEEDIGAGLVMFKEIDYKAMVIENRKLTRSEKESTSKIIDYLKTGKYLMESTRDVGYKTNYQVIDDETNEVSISEYERLNYYIGGTNGEMAYQSEWKFKERKAINQPIIYYSFDGGGNGDNNNAYCAASVEFEEGIGLHQHRSTLVPNNRTHNNVWDAVNRGVSGYVYFDIASRFDFTTGVRMRILTGEVITNGFFNLLVTGRLKLLSGEVREGRDYRETATDILAPYTLNNGDSVSLRLYTEDEGDFDYNDSFVTVVITNGAPTVRPIANNSRVRIHYNNELREAFNNANINNLNIWYKNPGDSEWREINNVNISETALSFEFPNLRENSQVRIGVEQ